MIATVCDSEVHWTFDDMSGQVRGAIIPKCKKPSQMIEPGGGFHLLEPKLSPSKSRARSLFRFFSR
jgi:hypothetical protein